MNPLTQVKNTQKITARETALGVSEAASWHAGYKDSAYVYAGNFPFELTEGDLLSVFAQYGEIVDLNLVRDRATGKSRGFAFLAYEDQRSTVLAVDNLNGATVVGRTIKVDHVANYKKKLEEDEEEEQRKREERGVCHAFQRGECNRGSACRFSHDEKRCRDTGWGVKNDPRWSHDKYDRINQSSYRKQDEDGKKYSLSFRNDGDNADRDKAREAINDMKQHRYKLDDVFSSKSEIDRGQKMNASREKIDKRGWRSEMDHPSFHGVGESSEEHGQRANTRREKNDERRHWQDKRDPSCRGGESSGGNTHRFDTSMEKKNDKKGQER